MEFTGYFDNSNAKIYLGDLLKNKWGFSVKVIKLDNGRYVGKSLTKCDYYETPYSLNCGVGYSICTNEKRNQD